MLLRLSRIVAGLSKAASNVSDIPGLAGPGGSTVVADNPHGVEGRMRRVAAARAKLKRIEGPRAYAPRISLPSP